MWKIHEAAWGFWKFSPSIRRLFSRKFVFLCADKFHNALCRRSTPKILGTDSDRMQSRFLDIKSILLSIALLRMGKKWKIILNAHFRFNTSHSSVSLFPLIFLSIDGDKEVHWKKPRKMSHSITDTKADGKHFTYNDRRRKKKFPDLWLKLFQTAAACTYTEGVVTSPSLSMSFSWG